MSAKKNLAAIALGNLCAGRGKCRLAGAIARLQQAESPGIARGSLVSFISNYFAAPAEHVAVVLGTLGYIRHDEYSGSTNIIGSSLVIGRQQWTNRAGIQA